MQRLRFDVQYGLVKHNIVNNIFIFISKCSVFLIYNVNALLDIRIFIEEQFFQDPYGRE
jgi:hypothetical protein